MTGNQISDSHSISAQWNILELDIRSNRNRKSSSTQPKSSVKSSVNNAKCNDDWKHTNASVMEHTYLYYYVLYLVKIILSKTHLGQKATTGFRRTGPFGAYSPLRPAAPQSCPPQTWAWQQAPQAEPRLSPSSAESFPVNTLETHWNLLMHLLKCFTYKEHLFTLYSSKTKLKYSHFSVWCFPTHHPGIEITQINSWKTINFNVIIFICVLIKIWCLLCNLWDDDTGTVSRGLMKVMNPAVVQFFVRLLKSATRQWWRNFTKQWATARFIFSLDPWKHFPCCFRYLQQFSSIDEVDFLICTCLF